MKIKVCGLTNNPESQTIAEMQHVHFVGFIFYKNSKRYTNESFPTKGKYRVGVFVDSSDIYILEKVEQHSLTHVQLHGNETTEFCQQLRSKVRVIKAFGIASTQDLLQTKPYEGKVDFFLFDTKTELHGGSGMSFNWQLLSEYTGNTPFFLSGGIGIESVYDLKRFKHPKLIGYDLNSKFEIAPTIKNPHFINAFIASLER